MEELVNLLMGRTRQDAETILRKKGLRYRYTKVDDKYCGITDDLNPYRVNLEAENNLITKVDFG